MGWVSRVSKGIGGDINDELPELAKKLMDQVIEMGGNALTHFSIDTGSYTKQDAHYVTGYLILLGKAVWITSD